MGGAADGRASGADVTTGERAALDAVPVVPDTTREDLLVEAARRLGPDDAFASMDDRAVADEVTTGAAQVAAATARWLRAVAELVVRGVWADDGARSPAVWLSWACGMGASTAREHVRVALRLRECPLVAARFAEGRLSYSAVRAITRVSTPAIEPMLLAWADAAPAAVLERIFADARRVQAATSGPAERDDLGATTRWRDDGTFELVVRTDAATGLGIEQHLDRLLEVDEADQAGPGEAVDAATDAPAMTSDAPGARPTRRQRCAAAVADALASAVARAPVDTSGADRHTVVLHAAAAVVLADDDHPAGAPADSGDTTTSAGMLVRDGRGRVRALSAAQLRRLACVPRLQLVDVNDGTVADLGRSRREPDARLRRLLHARDRSCRFPGCGAVRHLHAHHVVWWSEGGTTDLENLVLLCRHHHAVVHDRGWQLRSAGTGRWTFHPPTDHAAHDDGAWPARRPVGGASAAAVRLAAAVHAPDIGPRSLRPPDWDGGGYDHDVAVGVLVDRAAA